MDFEVILKLVKFESIFVIRATFMWFSFSLTFLYFRKKGIQSRFWEYGYHIFKIYSELTNEMRSQFHLSETNIEAFLKNSMSFRVFWFHKVKIKFKAKYIKFRLKFQNITVFNCSFILIFYCYWILVMLCVVNLILSCKIT